MHEIERHGDVTRIRLWSRLGAHVGYDVSVYETRGILIDTAFPRAAGEMRRLVTERRPRGAVVTHWHEDHAGNAPLLARLGVPLCLAPATLALLRERPAIRLYRRAVWGRPAPFPDEHQALAEPALALVPTPGHTPDHHVVWDAERRTLFSGDLWLGVRARLMHHDEDPRAIVQSLRAAAALGPERMFDAHRGAVTHPVRAIAARVAFLEETIGAIERAVAAGRSDGAIVREVLEGEESVALLSAGEYARRNLVRAVRRSAAGTAA
ncbi:MAG TPA: MBL fold metallo-hydrolase [Gemmatimonadaceae bacterium]|nr:MBL fold metallo-hydrolase [Gemmatimonadaceae bacterium]